MQKNLVIVESPAKAKTIEKFLGKDYKVLSSYGHIRDLKKKEFSIDIDKDFKPHYEIPGDKKKVVEELKAEAKEAETVWLASDEDREGEAIAWHLYEVLKLQPEHTKRIVFHEITQSAILKAIEQPRNIDINLVDAQQARRILDRIVGFELSPVLWKKVKPALSAIGSSPPYRRTRARDTGFPIGSIVSGDRRIPRARCRRQTGGNESRAVAPYQDQSRSSKISGKLPVSLFHHP